MDQKQLRFAIIACFAIAALGALSRVPWKSLFSSGPPVDPMADVAPALNDDPPRIPSARTACGCSA